MQWKILCSIMEAAVLLCIASPFAEDQGHLTSEKEGFTWKSKRSNCGSFTGPG